jgi:hypothetical protein
MPTVDDLSKSKYLKKGDVTPPKLVTIKGYEEAEMKANDGKKEQRWALTFKELDKPFVINKTNGKRIEKICGSNDFDDWIGKKVVLYFDEDVEFGGEIVGGVRVRAPQTAKPAPKPVVEPEPEPVDDTDYSQTDEEIPFP